MKINPELLEEFKELVQRDDYRALDYWYDKLNPLVKGLKGARKACLVSLASGNLDGAKRSRINVLLYGPGGTGKSEIRNWIKDRLDAVGAAPQSSSVGLVYDARGEGTKGALALADGNGTCVIEELGQFKKGVREVLRQAMESGYYEVNKGDKRKKINTRCKVIGVANEIDSFSVPLLQRFDLKVHISQPDEEEEKEITDHIYKHWEDKDEWDTGLKLQKYLDWVKSYQPEIDEETKERLMRMKNLFIDIAYQKGDESKGNIRQKETFYRSSKALARLNREKVKPEHYLKAIELHNGDLPKGVIDALKNVE